jgi:ribonuclease-3
MKTLLQFLKEQKLQPKRIELYELAFTHTSVNYEHKGIGKDYERLEFIGDAFLSMVVADLVFRLHPEWSQGELSKTRAKLVQTENLVKIAKQLQLADYVTIGHSITREGVSQSKKILEDIFEAFIGAVYLDQGVDKAAKYVRGFFEERIRHLTMDELTDYKTKLQEDMQAEFREAVHYETIKEEGPAHEKIFTVHVKFKEITLGEGKGPSKKIAEQLAAKAALSKKARVQ